MVGIADEPPRYRRAKEVGLIPTFEVIGENTWEGALREDAREETVGVDHCVPARQLLRNLARASYGRRQKTSRSMSKRKHVPLPLQSTSNEALSHQGYMAPEKLLIWNGIV
jgi:hypothetical protein